MLFENEALLDQVSAQEERKQLGTIKLGDTKERVKKVMGPPDQIIPFLEGGDWYYGRSSISFDIHSGKVDGWNNLDGNIPVD
ncbi:hypothetical protein CEN49_23425 [Fischerella thermalis CCMEE 5273]|nr:hypothetical protein CEN49_23425 [Fischerella thermalis CCMEE 5273]